MRGSPPFTKNGGPCLLECFDLPPGKNVPLEPCDLPGACSGHKFLASRTEEALGCANQRPKSEIPAKSETPATRREEIANGTGNAQWLAMRQSPLREPPRTSHNIQGLNSIRCTQFAAPPAFRFGSCNSSAAQRRSCTCFRCSRACHPLIGCCGPRRGGSGGSTSATLSSQ